MDLYLSHRVKRANQICVRAHPCHVPWQAGEAIESEQNLRLGTCNFLTHLIKLETNMTLICQF